MRRYSLAVALTFVVSLIVATGSAQAVVVDMNPNAQTQTNSQGERYVTYPTDYSSYYGIAMVPKSRANLTPLDVPTVTTAGSVCSDPALTADMFLPSTGLCSHGGPVLHKYETFALVWDPGSHRGWTAGYVEQFLRDVADGSASNTAHPGPSGGMSSPFALTPQYTGSNGPALYDSVYGGGIDDATPYPSSACAVSGTNPLFFSANGIVPGRNDVCLTDAEIQNELRNAIQQGLARTKDGYAPLLVMLTPPGVEVCLDNESRVCSANGDPTYVPNPGAPPAQFCSYHSQVLGRDGVSYPYVVQPVSALSPFGATTTCDEPDATPYPDPVPADQLATLTGQREVSPLSQAMIAAIVNPNFNAWFALDGSEINDNGSKIDDNAYINTDFGCIPVKGVDMVKVGNSQYPLQREFNNGGAIVQDPYALPCSGGNTLQPSFVVPSPVNAGDTIEFDGVRTPTTLLIPRANFTWNFGDGSTAVGASPVHAFAKGGTYTVSLTVIDRGGNTVTVSQPITITGPGSTSPSPSAPVTPSAPKLQARMQLMPQGLLSMLRSGVVIRVTSNMPANGVVTLSIPRADARRAHIKAHGASVVVGRGTVAAIKNGTVNLRVKLASATAKKLIHLRHLTVTIRIALVAKGAKPTVIVAAGRF